MKIPEIPYQDRVKCKPNGMIIVKIKQKNTEQPSYIFCTDIHYLHNKQKERDFFDHHIMVYNNKKLIFKVWLPNSNKDKEFKGLKEALESVGMGVQI